MSSEVILFLANNIAVIIFWNSPLDNMNILLNMVPQVGGKVVICHIQLGDHMIILLQWHHQSGFYIILLPLVYIGTHGYWYKSYPQTKHTRSYGIKLHREKDTILRICFRLLQWSSDMIFSNYQKEISPAWSYTDNIYNAKSL